MNEDEEVEMYRDLLNLDAPVLRGLARRARREDAIGQNETYPEMARRIINEVSGPSVLPPQELLELQLEVDKAIARNKQKSDDKEDNSALLSITKEGDGSVVWRFSPEARQTKMASWLLTNGLPEFINHFLSKNADYGDEHLTGRGPAGEFIGVERKVNKLGRILWEGQKMNHEGDSEILRDLVGSAFLILHMRAVGYKGKFTRSE